MVNGIVCKNGLLTLGFAPQVSQFSKEISIVKRDADGNKTDKRAVVQSNSGAKLNWFMLSNGGEPRKDKVVVGV